MASPEPVYVPFFGILGASASMIFCALGAALGTAKASMGISCMATRKPELLMKSLIPVVMAGIIAVYGLVVSVLISQEVGVNYSMEKSLSHLGAGLSVGLSGLAAGYAIGVVGDVGVRAYCKEAKIFVGMILILIFAEVLGLYGLILALILTSK
ncbi:V-type proton ATPase 16 kDa proteolipid subunit [Taenia solium]|eukprot:TsM_000274500 transcript=TsM_000274500 gene=TsM_000274500